MNTELPDTGIVQHNSKKESPVKLFNRVSDNLASNPPHISPGENDNLVVTDTHSRLNTIEHQKVVSVRSSDDLAQVLKEAGSNGTSVIASGGRHSMGGQQFVQNGILVNTRDFNRITSFDRFQGTVDVQPGIMWSKLVADLHDLQRSSPHIWSIKQKPTGADEISIGGSLSSNIHGRGLTLSPFVQDIEEFDILVADGDRLTVNRQQNSELFRLAIGGYGLFGLVSSVRLRLAQRRVMKRVVEPIEIDRLIAGFNDRIAAGHTYGDCQFAIDGTKSDFLRKGILATYVQTEETEPPDSQHKLSLQEWQELLYLAHVDKSRAYERYEHHYLKTNNQLYHSDTMQLSTYLPDYHQHVDTRTGAALGTEIISELYVPRDRLSDFMGGAADWLREKKADVIYGTIRLIQRDTETFLPWARDDYACVIFNIHTPHDGDGIAKSASIFNGLIEEAQRLGGSYYLTYHRFAPRRLVENSYPQFNQFLKKKLQYDPDERIQSEWYRHYRNLMM